MAKSTRRNTTKTNKEFKEVDVSLINKVLKTKHRLKCKNARQKEFANLITEKEIVISAGPAGVGKSYVAIARAIELLQNKTNSHETLIIVKPAIEAGEKLGYLPGDMREKMEPHVASSLDIIDKVMGKAARIQLEEAEIIKVEPLGFLRGKTIDDAIVVVEEVQNMSPEQVKTLLTRIGSNSKYVLSGDLDQSDRYRNVRESGLYDIMNRHRNIQEIGFFEFTKADIVRNPIISKILDNYETVTNDVTTIRIPVKVSVKEPKAKTKKKPNRFFRKLKIFFKRKFNS